MAGYKRRVKTVLLKFSDPEYAGFECEVKTLSVKQYLRMADLAEQAQTDGLVAGKAMLDALAMAIVRWNLEDDDGNPIPPTREALDEEDFDFVLSIVASWMEAMGGVDKDLGKGSNSGPRYPEGSLPMVPLSASRAS